MARLDHFEKTVARREGLADGYKVVTQHSHGGRDVRSDKVVQATYDFVRKLGDDKTVTDLIARAGRKIPGLNIKVVGPDRKNVRGNTKLGNIRN